MTLKKDKYLIVSGRFQPLHYDHLKLFKNVVEDFELNLIVCVLRNENTITEIIDTNGKTKFEKMSVTLKSKFNNPLPNWERMELINIAIRNDTSLNKKVSVSLRDHPTENWENSIRDLPANRIWVFNTGNGEFDKSKVDFYLGKAEKIHTLNYPPKLSGTKIRENLRAGDTELDFLPLCCHNFFRNNCIDYFIQDTIQ